PRLTISRRSESLIGPPPTTISLPDGASAARSELSKTVCHIISVSPLLEMFVEELNGDFIGLLAEGTTPTVAGPLKDLQSLGNAGLLQRLVQHFRLVRLHQWISSALESQHRGVLAIDVGDG